MTSTDPSASESIPTVDNDDDFTDIELAEIEDYVQPRDRVIDAIDANAQPEQPDDAAVAPPAATPDELREANATAASLRVHADRLGELDEADLADHVAYYQRAHGELQRALSDIDSA